MTIYNQLTANGYVVNEVRNPSRGSGLLNLAIPATGYRFAHNAQQSTNGLPIDTSPAKAVLAPISSALFPNAMIASTAINSGQRYTLPVPNGWIYVAGSSGTAGDAATIAGAAWPTTVGGTVTVNGIVFTAQKGPWFTDASGYRAFRTLTNATAGGPAFVTLPAAQFGWDLQQNDFIFNGEFRYDYNASGQGANLPILSSRNNAGQGFRLNATGGTFNNFRLQVFDGTTSVLSDDLTSTFARKLFDGNTHNLSFIISRAQRSVAAAIDGINIMQADMFTAAGRNPNGMNLSAVTGSTYGGDLTFGGNPGDSTSQEMAWTRSDIIVDPGVTGSPATIFAHFALKNGLLLPEAYVRGA